MRGLAGKSVLITGAAAGIGLATAQRFYDEGAKLLLVDIQAGARLGEMFPERMVFLQADVTTTSGLAQCRALIETHGLDVLINNAGITRDATIGKMSRTDWDAVIAVNLTAIFSLCQLAAVHMKAQGSGVILSASSVVAHYGNFGQVNYTATKAGVIGMMKSLSKELGAYGVRANAVAPGFIETAMVAKIPEKVLAKVREKPALKRMGAPEEIAAAYAFLASDDAAYITGTCLNVDGGIVLG